MPGKDDKRPPEDMTREQLVAEVRRLTRILNTPIYEGFSEAFEAEAAHQALRWATADRDKSPQDWFWLLGYLAGKALRAHIRGERTKALHHTISSAAALHHWHQAILRDIPTRTDG